MLCSRTCACSSSRPRPRGRATLVALLDSGRGDALRARSARREGSAPRAKVPVRRVRPVREVVRQGHRPRRRRPQAASTGGRSTQLLAVKFGRLHQRLRRAVCPPCRDEDWPSWRLRLGRFYLGSTCLRKAKLHFMASTLVPELLYTAWTHVRDLDEEEMRSGPLQWADEETADRAARSSRSSSSCASRRSTARTCPKCRRTTHTGKP